MLDKKRYHDLEMKKVDLWNLVKKDTKTKKDIEKRMEGHMESIRKIEQEQLSMVQYRLWRGKDGTETR